MNPKSRSKSATAASKVTLFTEEDVRKIVINYAETKCCHNSSFAKKMEILGIKVLHAYRYDVEAFMERREIHWVTTPYKPTVPVSPNPGVKNTYGIPLLLLPEAEAQKSSMPKMWNIKAEPNELFKHSTKIIEVPHTATVSTCYKCVKFNSVKFPCTNCEGSKISLNCYKCNGSGIVMEKVGSGKSLCSSCHGRGTMEDKRMPCHKCHGRGTVECKTCQGSGKLRNFEELRVTWKDFTEENIIVRGALQPDQIMSVGGKVILSEICKGPGGNPLVNFPDSQVRSASSKMFGKHKSAAEHFPNQKILNYRQTLIEILVAEVTFKWRSKTDVFYIYGNEKLVYFPNLYPLNCYCCKCSCVIF